MPKGNRAPDAKGLFLSALQRLKVAYEKRPTISSPRFPEARIINADAEFALSQMPADSIDCVVTSPPYYGVTDYVKAQRLTMEWLSEDIEPVRQREIGARSKRHRRTALENYHAELKSAFEQVYRVLRTGAVAVVVFGQSPSRPDAHTRFVADLEALGFTLCLDRQRNIPVGRRQMPSVAQETVLVFEK